MVPEKFYEENEELVIAIKKRRYILYAYPFDYDVASTGAKVITRTGATVHNIQKVEDKGQAFIIGIYANERHKWDMGGRYKSPYANSHMDLYIAERYFDPDWKSYIKMTHQEWQELYGKKHAPETVYPVYKTAEDNNE